MARKAAGTKEISRSSDAVPPPAQAGFFFNARNALAVTPSPFQVWGIVYGAPTPTLFAPAGIAHGGFFPNGVNGKIRSA